LRRNTYKLISEAGINCKENFSNGNAREACKRAGRAVICKDLPRLKTRGEMTRPVRFTRANRRREPFWAGLCCAAAYDRMRIRTRPKQLTKRMGGKMSLLHYFIRQSIKPEGNTGKIMLKIMNNAHKKLFETGMEKLNIHENYKILELGFGGGMALKLLSRRYRAIELFGVDFSDESVKIASRNNKEDVENGKIKLFKADIGEMPFGDSFFDAIMAFQTHYYWEEMENKVEEIYRVLKDKGQFIMVAEKYKINYHMKQYKTESEMKNLFKNVGFEQMEYEEIKDNVYIGGIK
jgi:ubiquinone/menaquinone biosynthesis C-methylase UbiE